MRLARWDKVCRAINVMSSSCHAVHPDPHAQAIAVAMQGKAHRAGMGKI
jgi:hypothetical protein